MAVVLFIGELTAIVSVLHRTLGPSLSSLGFYSRDFYVPIFLGFWTLAAFYIKRKKLQTRFSYLAMKWHLALIGSFGAVLTQYDPLVVLTSPAVASFLLLALVSSVILSLLFVFFDLERLVGYLRSQGSRVFLLILGVALIGFYPKLVLLNWGWLVKATGHCVLYALKILGLEVNGYDMNYAVGITHSYLNVSINSSCSGMEGVFFFLFSFCLYLFVAEGEWSGFRATVVATVGILVMCAVNVFRIVLFFCLCVYLNSIRAPGSALFSWAFHANVGWVLYLFSIATMLFLLRSNPHVMSRRSAV